MTDKYNKQISAEGYYSACPIPSSSELEAFYAETYYQDPKSSSYQSDYDELEVRYKNLRCNAVVHALKGHLERPRRGFIDVGAGEGFMLNAASKSGYEVKGLDFSEYGVAKFFPDLLPYHTAGNVYESLQRLIEDEKKFSICASINVLEHVVDPDAFMELLKAVIEPDGLIVITVPNDYSDIQKLALRENKIDQEFWFCPPHHLHYFNTENIIKMAAEHALNVIDSFSEFPVDLYLLHSGSNYINNPTLGREAHRARLLHDITIFEKNGMERYLDYYRAMFKVGLGRDITVILKP